MKIIKTGFKLYNDGNDDTNRNTGRQSGDIKQTIVSLSEQITGGSFEVAVQHY